MGYSMNRPFWRALPAAGALALIASAPADVLFQTGFEEPTYTVGDLASGDAATPGQDGWVAESYGISGLATPLFKVTQAKANNGLQSVRFDAGNGQNALNWAYHPLNLEPNDQLVTGEVSFLIETSTGGVANQSYGLDCFGMAPGDFFVTPIMTVRVRYDGNVEIYSQQGQFPDLMFPLVERDTWHKLVVQLDFSTMTATAAIDSQPILDSSTGLPYVAPFTKPILTDIDLYARNRAGSSERASGYFDDFKVESEAARNGTTVSGHVDLGPEFVGDPTTIAVTFKMFDSNGTLVDTVIKNLNADGTYSVMTPATNVASVSAKASHWLTQKQALLSPQNFVLTNGDIDGDNSITVFDYGVLSDYFDKSSADANWSTVGPNGFAPQDADLDADGSISVFDYSILSDHFDLNGD